MKKIEWTMTTGQKAEVRVELKTSEEINADGHRVTVKACEITCDAYVDDKYLSSGLVETTSAKVPGKIGRLCLLPNNFDRVVAAIDEIKQSPEWQKKEAKTAAAEKASDEYDTHRDEMRKVMGY